MSRNNPLHTAPALALFLFLTAFTANGQKPPPREKIERFYTFDWQVTDGTHARFYSIVEHTDSGWHRRDYYLHGPTLQMDGWYEDSAAKIPNGPITYVYPDKKLESTGRYLHGKKDGLWMTWHYNGMLADSTVYSNGHPIGTRLSFYPNGIIEDSSIHHADGSGVIVSWHSNGNLSSAGILAPGGKKNGKWQFWHDNGKYSALELYDHDSLLQYQYYSEDGQPVDTPRKDRNAIFKGGGNAWTEWLEDNMDWPEGYKITGADEAAIVISATIDESGNVTDVYVSTPFFPEFEKEALIILRHAPRWQPAIRHNRRVQAHIRQPVVFRQPKD
jgi:hypothetical protein